MVELSLCKPYRHVGGVVPLYAPIGLTLQIIPVFSWLGDYVDPRAGLDFSQEKVSYSCRKLNRSGLEVALDEVETISNEDC
jgi:hypothetical protein